MLPLFSVCPLLHWHWGKKKNVTLNLTDSWYIFHWGSYFLPFNAQHSRNNCAASVPYPLAASLTVGEKKNWTQPYSNMSGTVLFHISSVFVPWKEKKCDGQCGSNLPWSLDVDNDRPGRCADLFRKAQVRLTAAFFLPSNLSLIINLGWSPIPLQLASLICVLHFLLISLRRSHFSFPVYVCLTWSVLAYLIIFYTFCLGWFPLLSIVHSFNFFPCLSAAFLPPQPSIIFFLCSGH